MIKIPAWRLESISLYFPAFISSIFCMIYISLSNDRGVLFFPWELPAAVLLVFLSLNSSVCEFQFLALFVSFFIINLVYLNVFIKICVFIRYFLTNLALLRAKEADNAIKDDVEP